MERLGNMKLRIVIVEDHVLVSEGLETMLSTASDIEVCGVARSAAEAMEILRARPVDVVLMDVNLGRTINGIDATKLIKQRSPEIKILILTMYSDAATVSEAVRAGADGYMTKGSSRDSLLDAIREIAAARPFLDPNVTSAVFGRLGRNDPDTLTERELGILQEISYGQSTAEIAQPLGLAEETVKSYLKQIFKKLGVHDRTQAATEALRRDLIH